MNEALFQAAMATRDTALGPMDAWDIETARHFFHAGLQAGQAAQASSAPAAPSVRLQIAAQLAGGFMGGFIAADKYNFFIYTQDVIADLVLGYADALIAQEAKR